MLQKQLVGIDFTGGLDASKRDKKHVLPGKLTRLENAGFEDSTSLGKQGGYQTLATTGFPVDGVLTRDSELLVREPSGSLWSHTPSGFMFRGVLSPLSARKTTILRGSSTQSAVDCAFTDGILVFVWQDSRGGIRASTRAGPLDSPAVLPDAIVSLTGELPRCVATHDRQVLIFYFDGGDLMMRRTSADFPDSFSPEVKVATNAALSSRRIDVAFGEGVAFVAYRTNTNVLRILKVDTSGAVLGSVSTSENPNRGLACHWLSGPSALLVGYQEGTLGEVRLRSYDAGLGAISGPVLIEALPAVTVPRVAFAPTEKNASAYLLFEKTGPTDTTSVSGVEVDASGMTGALAVIARGVGLASSGFNAGTEALVAVVNESEVQPSLFVITVPGGVVRARVLSGRGGGLMTAPTVPKVPLLDNVHVLPALEQGRLTLEASAKWGVANLTPKGISAFGLFRSDPLQAVDVNGTLFSCGAAPSIYDGARVTEAGFHLFPEHLNLTINESGGDLSAGTYLCGALYEWTDQQGQRWQSALYPYGAAVVPEGGSITWTLPTLRLTLKHGVRIVPYRSEANGQILYRVPLPEDSPENDPTANSVPFTDTLADSVLISHEPAPNTGGVLDAGPIPACRAACLHRDRLVLAGLEDDAEYAISTVLRQGEGIRFNEALVYRLPRVAGAADGPLTACRSMDDRLFLFQEGATLVDPRDFPNDAGMGGTIGDAHIVAPDSGCTDWRTLVELPDGLARMTQKGLYLLTRGMQDVFFGEGVEDFNGLSFVGAVARKASNQARWYSSDSACLVWDWQRKQWSADTGHAAVGVVEWNGRLIHATPDWKLIESGGYTRNGGSITSVYETAWLKMAGLQGFQRVWRMLLLGQVHSACRLKVEVGYDYASAYVEAFEIDTGSVFGPAGVLELRHHLSQQKCRALRFRITESGGSGRGVQLTNLTLEVGVKRGGAKMAASRTV